MTVSEYITSAVVLMSDFGLWPSNSLLSRDDENNSIVVEWCVGDMWHKHKMQSSDMEDELQCLRVKIMMTLS